MILYIVRHAWAGQRDARQWPNDDDRPVSPEGRRRFRDVARKLVRREFAPALVATSPLVRCRQTADLLAGALDPPPDLEEVDALRPEGSLDAMIAWSNERMAAEMAWVGHAPEVAEWTAALVGADEAQLGFTKGGAAAIEFEQQIERGAGTLVWLVNAKILGC